MTIIEKAKECKELQQFIKQLQEEADTIKAEIINEMEEKSINTLHADNFTIRLSEYETIRLDGTRLKKEHSDIYGQYLKTGTAKRFQIA